MPTTLASPGSPAARRSSVRRSLGWRVVAVVVLIVFVCFVGDLRRRRIAMAQMERYATALGAQIGTTGVIPLNLSPDDLIGPDHIPIDMETLTRAQVGCLRSEDTAILVAWSVRLIQVLGRNGRATVAYEHGQTMPSWVTEDQFTEMRNRQDKRLETCP